MIPPLPRPVRRDVSLLPLPSGRIALLGIAVLLLVSCGPIAQIAVPVEPVVQSTTTTYTPAEPVPPLPDECKGIPPEIDRLEMLCAGDKGYRHCQEPREGVWIGGCTNCKAERAAWEEFFRRCPQRRRP